MNMPLPFPFRSLRAEENGFVPRIGFRPFQECDAESTIGERFREVARQRGDAAAIVEDDVVTTYSELLKKSDAIASNLHDHLGEGQGPIAIWLPFGAGVVESILGVLLAGRGYMTIEPRSPDSQVAMILDAATRLRCSETHTFGRDWRRWPLLTKLSQCRSMS